MGASGGQHVGFVTHWTRVCVRVDSGWEWRVWRAATDWKEGRAGKHMSGGRTDPRLVNPQR